MVTVIKTPLGHKLSDNILSGTAGDSSGDVLITTDISHGLSDGDYIYLDSNIKSYNGFRYVDSVSYNTFKVKESATGDYVGYKQAVGISYRVSLLQHGVQCVHLPIVYELESTISPNNVEEEEYQPNTVVSFSDNNGNVQIQLDHALTDPTRYAKIELVGEGDLSGSYQITQVINAWTVVIDLDYDASYIFDGYVVVKFYDNYAINVNVYAGLAPGHPWEDEKPIALIATLRLIPDDNNTVLFSINEYLRSLIKTVNETTIDTWPNNINFLTEFYIGYFESYDESDGDEIYTVETDEIIDSFTGQAINAKNEFKNLYSGHLSDYVSEEDHPAQWLTDFEEPIAIVGYFFDVSFYNSFNADLIVDIFKRSGESVVQETQNIDNPGLGVIRLEIEPEAGYDEYCVQVSTSGVPGSTTPIVLPALADWENAGLSPSLYDWNEDSAPDVDLPALGGILVSTSEFISAPYAFVEGNQYEITINYSAIYVGGVVPRVTGRIHILDSSLNSLMQSNGNIGTGFQSITYTFTATLSTTRVAFRASRYLGSSTVTVTISSVSGNLIIEEVPAQIITEQLCINILEECDSTLLGDLRELETGNFRLLE